MIPIATDRILTRARLRRPTAGIAPDAAGLSVQAESKPMREKDEFPYIAVTHQDSCAQRALHRRFLEEEYGAMRTVTAEGVIFP